LITYDEIICNANDSAGYSWKGAGFEWLESKAKCKGLLVSEFLCAAQGCLHHIDTDHGSSLDERPKRNIYATEILLSTEVARMTMVGGISRKW
jgi:hypothetical protein